MKLCIGTDNIVAGGSEIQDINITGIGRKQMGQSSLAGGSLNSTSSCSSAACCLHSALCVDQCFRWQSALQYLTSIHDLHVLRLTPPSTPHSEQQRTVGLSQVFIQTFYSPRHNRFYSTWFSVSSYPTPVLLIALFTTTQNNDWFGHTAFKNRLFDYVTDISVSCFASHLNAGIIVSCQKLS